MINFLRHKFTRKDKFLAKWGVSHVVGALIVGIALAGALLMGQFHAGHSRVRDLKQDAGRAVAEQANGQDTPVPPRTGKVGGPFSLTSQDGVTVTDKDFPGQFLLIYFGYTSCPDMCPTGLQSISRALSMLKEDDRAKVQPLFITVDPERDTPARLKQYDSSYYPKIIGLTGTPEQIADVAKEYQVYYQKGEGDQDYEIEHTSLIYLMDPDGNLVTTFDEQADPQSIISALQKAEADAQAKP